MVEKINPECISAVLDRLVGSTAAQADSTLDKMAQENVPAFRAVCEWVARRINSANSSMKSPYGSAQETARSVMSAAGDLTLLWDYEEGRAEWLVDEVKSDWRLVPDGYLVVPVPDEKTANTPIDEHTVTEIKDGVFKVTAYIDVFDMANAYAEQIEREKQNELVRMTLTRAGYIRRGQCEMDDDACCSICGRHDASSGDAMFCAYCGARIEGRVVD